MQTVEIGADTKSCRDISRLFKDYLVRYEISDLFLKNRRMLRAQAPCLCVPSWSPPNHKHLPTPLNCILFVNNNCDQTLYLYLDHYSKSGPNFSGENGLDGSFFLEFWSPGPIFFAGPKFQRQTHSCTTVGIWK